MNNIEGVLSKIDENENREYDRQEIYRFLSAPTYRQEFSSLLNTPENKERLKHVLDTGFGDLLIQLIEGDNPLAVDETVCHAFQLYLRLHGEQYTYSVEYIENWIRTLQYFQEEHPNITTLLLTLPIHEQLQQTQSFRNTYTRLGIGYPKELQKFDETLQLVKTYTEYIPVDSSAWRGKLLIESINKGGTSSLERKADVQFQYLYIAGHEQSLLQNSIDNLLQEEAFQQTGHAYQASLDALKQSLYADNKSNTRDDFLSTIAHGKTIITTTKTIADLQSHIHYHQLGVLMGMKTYIEDTFGRIKNNKLTPQYAELLLQIASLLDKETLGTMEDMFGGGRNQAEQITSDMQKLRRQLSSDQKRKTSSDHTADICVLDLFLKGVTTQKDALHEIQTDHPKELKILPYILSRQQHPEAQKQNIQIMPRDASGLLFGGPYHTRAIEAKKRATDIQTIDEIDQELFHLKTIQLPYGGSITGVLPPEDETYLLDLQASLEPHQQLVYMGSTGLQLSQLEHTNIGAPWLGRKTRNILSYDNEHNQWKVSDLENNQTQHLPTETLQDLSLLQGGVQEHLKARPLVKSALTVSVGLQTLTTPLYEVLSAFSSGEKLTSELVANVRNVALQLSSDYETLKPHIATIHELAESHEELAYLRLVLGDDAFQTIESIKHLDALLYNESGSSQFEVLLIQLTNARHFNENDRSTRLQNNALKILGGVAGAVALITFSVGTLGLGTPLAIGAAGALGGMIGLRFGQVLNEGLQDGMLAVAATSGKQRLVYDDPTDIEILMNNPTKEQTISIIMNMSVEFFLGMISTYGFIKVGQRVGSVLPSIPNQQVRESLIRLTRLESKTRPPIPLDVDQSIMNFMKQFAENFREELGEELIGIGLEKATEHMGYLSILGDLANIYFCIQPGGNKQISLRSYDTETNTAIFEYDANDADFIQETQLQYRRNNAYTPQSIDTENGKLSYTYTENGKTYTIQYVPSSEMLAIRSNPNLRKLFEAYNITYDPNTRSYHTDSELTPQERGQLMAVLKQSGLLVQSNPDNWNMEVINEHGSQEYLHIGSITDGETEIVITARKEMSEQDQKRKYMEELKNQTTEMTVSEESNIHVVYFNGESPVAPGGVAYKIRSDTGHPNGQVITILQEYIHFNGVVPGPFDIETNMAALLRSIRERYPNSSIQRTPYNDIVTDMKHDYGIDLNQYIISQTPGESPESGARNAGNTTGETTPPTESEEGESTHQDPQSSLESGHTGHREMDTALAGEYTIADICEYVGIVENNPTYQSADMTVRKVEDTKNPHVLLEIQRPNGKTETFNVTEEILLDLEDFEKPSGYNTGQLLGLAGISPFNLKAIDAIAIFKCEINYDTTSGYPVMTEIISEHFKIQVASYRGTGTHSPGREIRVKNVAIEPGGRPLFSGLEFMKTLTDYAIENNFGKIELYAARSGGVMNGYYTRGRMGFAELENLQADDIYMYISDFISNPYSKIPETVKGKLENLCGEHRKGRVPSLIHAMIQDADLREFRRLYGIGFEGYMELPSYEKPNAHHTYEMFEDYVQERTMTVTEARTQETTPPPPIRPEVEFTYRQRAAAKDRQEHLEHIARMSIEHKIEQAGLEPGTYAYGVTGSDGRGENQYDASNIEIIFYAQSSLSESQKTTISSIINNAFGPIISQSAQDGPIDIEFRDNPTLSLLQYVKDGAETGFSPARILDMHFLNASNYLTSRARFSKTSQFIVGRIQESYTELQETELTLEDDIRLAQIICENGTEGNKTHFDLATGEIYYNFDSSSNTETGISNGPIQLVQLGLVDCIQTAIHKGLSLEGYKQLIGTDTTKRTELLISTIEKAKKQKLYDISLSDRSQEEKNQERDKITSLYDNAVTQLHTIQETYTYFLQIHLGMQSQFQQANKPDGGINRNITAFGSTTSSFHENVVALQEAMSTLRETLHDEQFTLATLF